MNSLTTLAPLQMRAQANNTSSDAGLISFDMPPLSQNGSTKGRFCGQSIQAGASPGAGMGVAIWPTGRGSVVYSGQVLGKQVHGLGVIEFPNVQSPWSVASGKFERGMFSFGSASAGDVLNFLIDEWQAFLKQNIQTIAWKTAEFKGQWKDGIPSQGITILPDGSRHIGSWKDGKWHDSGMYVDTLGNWCKGIYSKGTLVVVTHRSIMRCSLPSKYAPLLETAEVTNISAQLLQSEYKPFQDIADKLALEGSQAGKLAKSISNIAFLKSERILGLPAHAVESSLNSLASLIPKASTVMANAPTSNPLQQLNLSNSQGVIGSQTLPQAQQLQYQSLLGLIQRSQSAYPVPLQSQSQLTSLVSQGSTGNLQASVKEATNLQRSLPEKQVSPIVPTATKGSKIAPKLPDELNAKVKKVALLYVDPPVMEVGGQQSVLIEGCCTTEKELHDISVLCICGSKFVKCKTMLKKLSTEKNIHSKNGMPTFQLKLSFEPAMAGVTYFLLASNKLQHPFPLSATYGPCRATLTMNNSSNEYHVAPLLVVDSSEVCKEIKDLFAVKYDVSTTHQTRYNETAEFLQHFGTFISAVNELKQMHNGSAPKNSSMRQIFAILIIASSRLWLPHTLRYLCDIIEKVKVNKEDVNQRLADHLYDIVQDVVEALDPTEKKKVDVIDILVNKVGVPIHCMIKKAGSQMSVMHLVASSSNTLPLLQILLASCHDEFSRSQWIKLRDSKGTTPLQYAIENKCDQNVKEIKRVLAEHVGDNSDSSDTEIDAVNRDQKAPKTEENAVEVKVLKVKPRVTDNSSEPAEEDTGKSDVADKSSPLKRSKEDSGDTNDKESDIVLKKRKYALEAGEK